MIYRCRRWVANFILAALLAVTGGPSFAQPATEPAPLRAAIYQVTLNGERLDEPALFLRDAGQLVYIPASMLRAWRVRPPREGGLRQHGELYYPAREIPQLVLSIDEPAQAILLSIPPEGFEMQSTTLADEDQIPMTPPSNGGFLNYDLLVERVPGETTIAGAFEVGVFSRLGVGITRFAATTRGSGGRIDRLDTSWTIDRPGSMTSIRIGDAISPGGPGAYPFRFAGIQFARNFSTRPGFLTIPLPTASGNATVPSVVDVYVNGILQRQQQVGPGPFELGNVPVPTGGGDVQLVVRDVLGREVVTTQRYYASSGLLRRGLHDFSYEAGVLREDYGVGVGRYGRFFAAMSHRYGLTDKITGEAAIQASETVQMASVAANALIFGRVQVAGSGSISHSRAGNGYRVAASAEHRSRHASFGVLTDYSSRRFTFEGLSNRPLPRFSLLAFANVPWSGGAIGLNLLRRSFRGQSSETVASLSASWRVRDRLQLQAYASYSRLERRGASVGINLSISLGQRRSASASAEAMNGAVATTLNYQDNPPEGIGDGFRVTARLGENSGIEASYVRNLGAASLFGQVSHARGATGLRVSASGSIGLIDGRLFAARALGESFSAVIVPGLADVRIYADNQQIGRTDRRGVLIVPAMRAFERNTLRIEQGDLPLDVVLGSEEIAVRPPARAGFSVRFDARRERGALLRVRLADGRSLPIGARLRAEGRADSYVVVTDGEVYVRDLSRTLRLSATWAGGSCGFTVTRPADTVVQPTIDGIICEAPAYAAR